MTGTEQPRHGTVSHTPLKSGLPSGAFGVGASMLTLPSAVFGTLDGAKRGHCARRAGDTVATRASVAAMHVRDT